MSYGKNFGFTKKFQSWPKSRNARRFLKSARFSAVDILFHGCLMGTLATATMRLISNPSNVSARRGFVKTPRDETNLSIRAAIFLGRRSQPETPTGYSGTGQPQRFPIPLVFNFLEEKNEIRRYFRPGLRDCSDANRSVGSFASSAFAADCAGPRVSAFVSLRANPIVLRGAQQPGKVVRKPASLLVPIPARITRRPSQAAVAHTPVTERVIEYRPAEFAQQNGSPLCWSRGELADQSATSDLLSRYRCGRASLAR